VQKRIKKKHQYGSFFTIKLEALNLFSIQFYKIKKYAELFVTKELKEA
jgi:hypothetical protein